MKRLTLSYITNPNHVGHVGKTFKVLWDQKNAPTKIVFFDKTKGEKVDLQILGNLLVISKETRLISIVSKPIKLVGVDNVFVEC